MGCDRVSSPSDTAATANVTGPSAVSPQEHPLGAAAAKKGPDERLVNMMDACDPETFNAALGPGTCLRPGGVRFDLFLELLGRHGSVGAWHFAPSQLTMHEGGHFVAVNNGGEVHTFTEVDQFAGGIVPALNAILGLTTVAPECQALDPGDFVAPGATFREDEEEGEEAGTVRYQCCIHPWMRLEAKVLPH
jgi:hypothetical protein